MALEREEIARALRSAGGNIGKAARELRASRRTLQNRMRFYGIPRGKAGRPKRRLYAKRRGWLVGAAVVGLAGVLAYRSRGKVV